MDTNALFTLALGLLKPWVVTDLEFDEEKRRLDLHVHFAAGSVFPCPECGTGCKVHDTKEREWRHLNFFQHETYLHARVPRTKCDVHGVKTVEVPWARPGSGFTLLFEALVMAFARNGMTMSAISRLVGEHDTRLWRVVEHYVEEALARLDLSALAYVGIDETSRARGHNYLTLFVDLKEHKVVFIALGRDSDTLKAFREELEKKGGKRENIKELSIDMSGAYIAGASEQFPDAHLTFDKFHVIKLMNEAIDEVRRDEQKKRPALKKTRFLWLRNRDHLKEEDRARFEALRTSALATARAYAYREQLQAFYQEKNWGDAWHALQRWYQGAVRCRLAPVQRVARTIKAHSYGVLRWFDSGLTNGLLEGFSSLVQAAKARARGYRSEHYMRLIIHLLLSKLDLRLPPVLGSPSPT